MTRWSKSQQRKLGWFFFVVAVVTLAVAFALQPVIEWGTLGYALAVVVLFAGIDGLVMGIWGVDISFGFLTMQGGHPTTQYESRLSSRSERIFAIVGLGAVTIGALGLLADDWGAFTATDILTVGFWVGAAGLFISQLAFVGRDEKSGAAPPST
ncbi:MAG: hypothetical protein VW239_03735 [Candidatus Nanopelagicales bacterium]|jgi:hypothetical protein